MQLLFLCECKPSVSFEIQFQAISMFSEIEFQEMNTWAAIQPVFGGIS